MSKKTEGTTVGAIITNKFIGSLVRLKGRDGKDNWKIQPESQSGGPFYLGHVKDDTIDHVDVVCQNHEVDGKVLEVENIQKIPFSNIQKISNLSTFVSNVETNSKPVVGFASRDGAGTVRVNYSDTRTEVFVEPGVVGTFILTKPLCKEDFLGKSLKKGKIFIYI